MTGRVLSQPGLDLIHPKFIITIDVKNCLKTTQHPKIQHSHGHLFGNRPRRFLSIFFGECWKFLISKDEDKPRVPTHLQTCLPPSHSTVCHIPMFNIQVICGQPYFLVGDFNTSKNSNQPGYLPPFFWGGG